MAWVKKYESSVNGVSDGTFGLIDKLYDWLTGASAGFPGTLFTGVLKNGGLSAGANVSVSFNGTLGTPVSIPRTDLSFYALRRNGVTYWIVCDLGKSAAAGGARATPNMGIFFVMTETATIDTADELFNTFSGNLSDQPINGANTTGSTSSFMQRIWPTYGAVEADFFSDGDRVHVAFRRSVSTYTSYQHFSIGVIDKASTSWTGGEYMDGCSVNHSLVNGWDEVDGTWHYTNRKVLSGSLRYQFNANNQDTEASYMQPGILRVVGIKDISNVAQNYAMLGFRPWDDTIAKTHFTGFAGVVGMLGGVTRGYTVNESVLTSATATRRAALMESPNSWNGRTAGFGVDLFAMDLYNTPKTSMYLGSVPGIRFIRIDGLSDRQLINNEWMVFPIWSRGAAHVSADETGYPTSGNFGIAYKTS